MKILPSLIIGLSSAVLLTQPGLAVTYSTILGVNDSVTGVRGYDNTDVILTGSYVQSGETFGMWWQGDLSTGLGAMYKITPNISGQSVTSSLFYGPNTALFNPDLGPGNIRVVGSYKYASAPYPGADHGAMYTGAVDGTGSWIQIDVPNIAAGGANVLETIPHSTMGNFVVGNYDLHNGTGTPIPGSANAFLYNVSENEWQVLDIGGTSNFTSAYGIWQNGPDSYTIAGGSMHGGINKAYLMDFTPSTNTFSNLTFFEYEDQPGLTHFEGITEAPGGYNVIATTDVGAAFAYIPREGSGYGEAVWTALSYPGNEGLTTGNTVYQNIGMGIYNQGGSEHSYIATIPEPGTYALFAFGLVTLCVTGRRLKA